MNSMQLARLQKHVRINRDNTLSRFKEVTSEDFITLGDMFIARGDMFLHNGYVCHTGKAIVSRPILLKFEIKSWDVDLQSKPKCVLPVSSSFDVVCFLGKGRPTYESANTIISSYHLEVLQDKVPHS